MKKLTSWIILILILILILLIRISVRSHYKTKFLFKGKEIIKIEFKDIDNKDVVLKKENDDWIVLTATAIYPANKERIKLILEKLEGFKLSELISKKPSTYENYQLNESSATKIRVYYGKNKSKDIWFGKTGGFIYNECYVRIDEKPEVYLASGITSDEFMDQFYHYCSRTILKSDIDKINFVRVRIDNKTYEFKKELKDDATTWVNLKVSKKIDSERFNSYLRNFDEFIGDVIIEPTDYNLDKLIKPILEINLKYEDNTEVLIYVYDKLDVKIRSKWSTNTLQLYPVKIKCLTSKGPSVEIISNENIVYCIYDFRFKNLKTILEIPIL